MANTISVYSTVAQAEGFDVEVADSTLLATRYFPTTAGDEFAGKEVLFDFDSSDLEKGAFLSSGYKDGNTVSWIANSVIPPRVANSDVVDPADQDRQLFERLCRAQGADLNRAEAYQELLNLKSARLAKRTDRAIEVLASLVLSEGKIDFDQDKDPTSGETEHIVCKFYDPAKGADNHYVVSKVWSSTTDGVASSSAKPYADVCEMVNAMLSKGKRPNDLLLGASAWANLSRDQNFQRFAGATYHSDGMMIDFGEVEGAQHVAKAVFNGIQLNVIVYGAGYKTAEGTIKQFIDSNAAIVISENLGRTLCGGATLLNPDSIGYGIENSFVGLTGKHLQSIYKDFNSQKLHIREESRPLPAPKHSVNEWDWVYCDTATAAPTGGFPSGVYELYKGVKYQHDTEISWSSRTPDSNVLKVGDGIFSVGTVSAASGKTTKFYAIRDGKKAEEMPLSGVSLTMPHDLDRDANGNALIYVTAV